MLFLPCIDFHNHYSYLLYYIGKVNVSVSLRTHCSLYQNVSRHFSKSSKASTGVKVCLNLCTEVNLTGLCGHLMGQIQVYILLIEVIILLI